MTTIFFIRSCSATSALNESSISSLNISLFFCNICRNSSWTRDYASVDPSFDMYAVVCVASEVILLVLPDLLFLLLRLGKESTLLMS